MTLTKQVCKSCLGKKQESVFKGPSVASADFPGDKSYLVDKGGIKMVDCSRCKGTGLEPVFEELEEHYQNTIKTVSVDSENETTEQQSDVATISLTKSEACICLQGLGWMENETSPLEGEDKELYNKLSKFTD